MAWETTMVTMVRVLVNDTEAPEQYVDSRLEQIIVVAAEYVQQDINLSVVYDINVDVPDISPDPTLPASKDDVFTNFVVLRAACIVDHSTFRTEAFRSGIKARCGPALLETLDRLKGFNTLLNEGPCKAYAVLKKEHNFGNDSIIRAILSPFISNNFDSRSLASIQSFHRDAHGSPHLTDGSFFQ